MGVAALRYLAFALLALVGPGVAAQRLVRVRVDPALVIPLGSALTAGLYWCSLYLGLPWLFPIGTAALDLTLLLHRERRPLADGPSLRGALAPCLGLVLLFALTEYSSNRMEGGEFLLDPMGDHPLHVGVTRELTLPYPPQVPGLSGVPLRYHYGADLVRAAALRWAGVDPHDAINRFELTLGAFALVLALRTVAQRIGAAPLALALVPWTLLATDFSFFFSGIRRARLWSDIFRGNLLISLVFANPVVAALALALGALVALSRYEAGEGRGWLPLAAAQALAASSFKVFMGAHLLLGLACAALLCPGRARLATALTALCPLLGLLPLALGGGAGTVEVALAPLGIVRDSLEGNLKLALPTSASLALWTLPWLGVSLGLRVLGLPGAVQALRSGQILPTALAAMALSGWPLGVLFRVSARGLTGQPLPSATIYFVEQAGCLLWIFTAMALAAIATRVRRPALVIAASALLALPSTVEFVVRKMRQPIDSLPAPMVRAMRALEEASPPGAVVLQKPSDRFPPAPVLLIGRRVPYERFTPYLTQFARPEDLSRRHETVVRFFQTRDPIEALRVARSLGASFVCLYDSDRVRFDARDVLEAVYEEDGARVYRIRFDRLEVETAPGPEP